MSKPTKKCARENCLTTTTKEYCVIHAPHHYKLNPCAWPGCTRNCRANFCHNHNPTLLQNKNEKARLARKEARYASLLRAN